MFTAERLSVSAIICYLITNNGAAYLDPDALPAISTFAKPDKASMSLNEFKACLKSAGVKQPD